MKREEKKEKAMDSSYINNVGVSSEFLHSFFIFLYSHGIAVVLFYSYEIDMWSSSALIYR